jgi:hypothetical protein
MKTRKIHALLRTGTLHVVKDIIYDVILPSFSSYNSREIDDFAYVTYMTCICTEWKKFPSIICYFSRKTFHVWFLIALS